MKKISIDELLSLLDQFNHKEAHIHHTWKPNKENFNGSNHMKLQEGMKNHHVNVNGWSDIGQHVTLFPDGTFVTGRDFARSPASIKGYNTGAFCVEMLGNFDVEKLEGEQLESIIKLAKYFDDKGRYVRFHRENSSKTCPGTKIDKTWFMNKVRDYSPIPQWKLEGLQYLHKNDLLLDLEGWKTKINDPMPVWATALILKRIHESSK